MPFKTNRRCVAGLVRFTRYQISLSLRDHHLPLNACSATTASGHDELMDRMQQLKRQLAEVQREVSDLCSTMETLTAA